MPRLKIFVLAAALVVSAACDSKSGNTNSGSASPPPARSNQPNRTAVIETDAGTIKFELLFNEAPQTAENFLQLAERGFYNGVIFHRTISGFMIQGGDPSGSGRGGETATGAPLPNEVNPNSQLYQGGYRRGIVAMANKGRPETGTSQFFIMHQNYPLEPKYTIFGRVTEGMEVVDKIATAPVQGDRPVTPVVMKKVYIQ